MIAIIWRQSVMENGYRCTVCGKRLYKLDKPTKYLETMNNYAYCRKCGMCVAKMQEIPNDIGDYAKLQGLENARWEEVMQKLVSDQKRAREKQQEAQESIDACRKLEHEVEVLKQRVIILKEQLEQSRKMRNEDAEAHLAEKKIYEHRIRDMEGMLKMRRDNDEH